MAGEISVNVVLTQSLLNELTQAGLTLDIQVDCSHNAFVQTTRSDRPGNPIMVKPIELDVAIQPLTAPQVASVMGKMQAARSNSGLFQLYSAMNRMSPGRGPVNLSSLTRAALKVEFPNFDASIVNLVAPPEPLATAVQACSATTTVAFNALPPHVRSSMGMYRRGNSNAVFTLVGNREPGPRTA